ncbi:MAG: hypothetical protein NTW03_13015 [Verrucomicrobia bacterium]|nr:hypothetical protein [Verrucomicrobiota bacterium]
MKFGSVTFNTYFCGLAWLALAMGCSTPDTYESKEDDPSKQLTVLRLHIETTADAMGRSAEVPVFRARPVMVTIEREAFLTEQHVISAELVDEPGGFSLLLEFEREGRWNLESYTAGHLRRRIAIFAGFPHERWLGAPVITKVISDGKLKFTPDATREEAVRIVRGLNNMARKVKHDPRF